MIYSLRAQPKVNESHIHEVPKSNRLSFHMGEVSELWHKTMVSMFSFIVLKSRPVLMTQKANIQVRVPELNSHVFNLGKC